MRAGQAPFGCERHAHAAFRLHIGPFGSQAVVGHQDILGNVADQAVVEAPGRVLAEGPGEMLRPILK